MSGDPSVRTLKILTLVALISVGATYLAVVPAWGAIPLIGVLLWMVLPGVAIARRVMHSEVSGAHWLLGPVWGNSLSLIGLLVLWVLGARGVWILVLAPWPAWLLLLLPLDRMGVDLHLPRFGRRDVAAVLLLTLLVPAIVGRPYAHVAEPVDGGGKAYRAYFTADFVWAMTVVAEVSKGDMPPKNPFQLNGTLNYYWLAHFLSAVDYRVLGPRGLTIEAVTLGNSIGYCLIFIMFLYGFVRALGTSTAGALVACGLVFLANSFEALDRIVVWWHEPHLFQILTTINLDAVTRWFYSGMPVDGLHRLFLYQPHHLGGYATGLSALLVVSRAADVRRPMVALVSGMCLALTFLLTSFTAIILSVAVSIVYAVRLLRPFRLISIPVCALLGALPIGVAYYVSQALAYLDPKADHLVIFGLNHVAASHWPYALLISFGPMLILGGLGLVGAVWTRHRDAWPAAVLAAVALGFYFLTDVPDMQHVWVGWRAGHLLFIASCVLTGVLITVTATRHVVTRWATAILVAGLGLAALPTIAMDIYNAQDVSNTGFGPGFPWTLRLSGGEVEALDWLKSHTPPTVIVQTDVRERANASWGYMPAFGERRMAAGLPIALIPFQPYQDATDAVGNQVFDYVEAPVRRANAVRLGIDYLYVGPDERRAHPDLIPALDARSDLFPAVFRNADVVIYWVAP